MKRWWNSFKIACTMYSRIPMPDSDWTEENMSYAMCFFPWIGAIIGGLTWGAYELERWVSATKAEGTGLFFTVLLLLIPVIVTGGIHLDGLLDTVDALQSYQPPKRRLEILNDPHAGAFAVIGCAVYFLAYLGVYSLRREESVQVICVGFFLSRTLSAISVICFPKAKADGTAASFSEHAAKKTVFRVLLCYLILTGAVMAWLMGLTGIAALAAAAGMFGYYYRMSKQKFGGITGDLAGYFLQMCELCIAAAAVFTAAVRAWN